MEFCSKGTIEDYLDVKKTRTQIAYEIKLRICQEIAEGMNYLHEREIIHRDLKPKNVMLDSRYVCKIIDFG